MPPNGVTDVGLIRVVMRRGAPSNHADCEVLKIPSGSSSLQNSLVATTYGSVDTVNLLAGQHPPHHPWPHYYLDFCHKYNLT